MSRRVFDTYHAPDEEIEGVKSALDKSGIPWFETVKGRWWVGSAALWVRNTEDYDRARQAIDVFQADWVRHQRETRQPERIRWNRVPVLVVVVGIVLYLLGIGFWL